MTPIFSVDRDLAFNWAYADNGCRIAVTGGHLSEAHIDDDETHGLGNHFAIDLLICRVNYPRWAFEISNIQDCPLQTCKHVKVQGDDHGTGPHLYTGPAYGQYVIFISRYSNYFPYIGNRTVLNTIMEDIPL